MLGENVRRVRKESNLTQTTLAERAGIGQSYLAQIESGKKQPTVGILMKLATSLGVSLDALVTANSTDDVAIMQK